MTSMPQERWPVWLCPALCRRGAEPHRVRFQASSTITPRNRRSRWMVVCLSQYDGVDLAALQSSWPGPVAKPVCFGVSGHAGRRRQRLWVVSRNQGTWKTSASTASLQHQPSAKASVFGEIATGQNPAVGISAIGCPTICNGADLLIPGLLRRSLSQDYYDGNVHAKGMSGLPNISGKQLCRGPLFLLKNYERIGRSTCPSAPSTTSARR